MIANTFLPFDTDEFLFLEMDATVIKFKLGLNEQYNNMNQYYRRHFKKVF